MSVGSVRNVLRMSPSVLNNFRNLELTAPLLLGDRGGQSTASRGSDGVGRTLLAPSVAQRPFFNPEGGRK